MKTIIFNYHEALCLIPKKIMEPIEKIIAEINVEIKPKNAPAFRKEFIEKLYSQGWNEKAGLSYDSRISITAYNEGVGLCCQTGNVSRIYADMLKLQTLWVAGTIMVGIIILPIDSNAKILGDNMANYERLVRELNIFERVITMPLLIIGVNGLEE